MARKDATIQKWIEKIHKRKRYGNAGRDNSGMDKGLGIIDKRRDIENVIIKVNRTILTG